MNGCGSKLLVEDPQLVIIHILISFFSPYIDFVQTQISYIYIDDCDLFIRIFIGIFRIYLMVYLVVGSTGALWCFGAPEMLSSSHTY